jgi:hypothetical protein
MAQSTTAIRQAFETQLLTVTAVTSANLIKENQTFNFASVKDPTGLVYVRTTLRPNMTTVETLGTGCYVKSSGLMVLDVIGQLDKGYTTVTGLADTILAAFKPGTRFTLSTGDVLTVVVASPTDGGSQAAWNANRLFAVTLTVEYYTYILP